MPESFEMNVAVTERAAPFYQMAGSFDHRGNLHVINQNQAGNGAEEDWNRKYSKTALAALQLYDAFDSETKYFIRNVPQKIGGPMSPEQIKANLAIPPLPSHVKKFADFIDWALVENDREAQNVQNENLLKIARLTAKLDEHVRHDEIAKKVTFEAVRQLNEAHAKIEAFEKSIFGRIYTWLKNRKSK